MWLRHVEVDAVDGVLGGLRRDGAFACTGRTNKY
jgi:hypothetical protein